MRLQGPQDLNYPVALLDRHSDDAGRLMEACLSTPKPAFRVVWGISRNTRRWWSLAAGEEIGYHPQDDSEAYAADVLARHGDIDRGDPVQRLVGGEFCTAKLGAPQGG